MNTDYLHKIVKWFDHNRYKALAIVIFAALMVWGIGCQSKTASLQDISDKVTRPQFEIEVINQQTELAQEKIALEAAVDKFNAKAEAVNAKIEAGRADLARQDQIKAEIFNLVGSVVTQWATEGVPTGALVGTGITAAGILLGVGGLADGIRKDKVIEKQKVNNNIAA